MEIKVGILVLGLLLASSGVFSEQLSTDPCAIFLGETRSVEYLDENADYRASNCQQMSEDVGLAWKIDGNTITFEVHALTDGWVSVGINTGPSMRSADVAVGWVNHKGEGFMFDGRTDLNVKELPKKDESQDVTLLKYREMNGYTSFMFSRPVISQDKVGDRDIKGRVWIIWATATEDPDDDDWEDLAFHNREGATSIRFPIPELQHSEL